MHRWLIAFKTESKSSDDCNPIEIYSIIAPCGLFDKNLPNIKDSIKFVIKHHKKDEGYEARDRHVSILAITKIL